MCACVCVYLCVYVSSRARKRERDLPQADMWSEFAAGVCVYERERE